MPDLQPPQPATPQAPSRGGGADTDPLAGLKKMSTTAGLGSGDYVAINPVALVAFLLGVSSLLAPVFNVDLLLLIPAAGVVCALIAFHQIRTSNGTQTGRGLALGGLALSVLIGGGVVASRVVTAQKYGPARRDIAAVIRQLGEEIAAAGDATRAAPPATGPASGPAGRPDFDPAADRHYDAAYKLFTDRFRARVNEQKFKATWADVNRSAETGLRGMEWNGNVEFSSDTGSGTPVAWAMALVKLNKAVDPPRQAMQLTQVGGAWQIEDIPSLFPPEKPPAPAAKSGP